MKKIEFQLEPFKEWMVRYYHKNKQAPDLSEIKISNGAPFNKTVVLRNFNSYAEACNACGIPSRSEKSESLKKRLLEELRNAVLKHRTTDRDYLRKTNEISDRSRYERLFGSWKESLVQAGIGYNEKYLISMYDDYNGEDPINFIKNKYQENKEWNLNQLNILNILKENNGSLKALRNSVNFKVIKKEFGYTNTAKIAAGFEATTVSMKKQWKAKDGHLCDSKAEMELDNWLHENGFSHEIHKMYPNSRMVSDFYVNNIYIEYAGLTNSWKHSNKYNEKIERKVNHCKKYSLPIIIVENLNQESISKLRVALAKQQRKQTLN